MKLIQLVQDIMLKPKETWPVIAQEESDTATIYTTYLVYLAAIPALAGFVGMSLIGASAFGISVRIPIVSGLVNMVVGYGLSLGMVFALALVVDALAPTFGGTKSPINALKLVAYGSTAGFMGGIFSLLPVLSALGLLTALYSIYLVYTGLPVLMKCPPEKAVGYTAVVMVCALVVGILVGAILGIVSGASTMGMGTPTGQISFETSKGAVSFDTAKMEALGKRMEEVGSRMEKAQQSGDQAAMEQAIKEMAALQKELPMEMPK